MITPTVGRIVHFRPGTSDPMFSGSAEPLAAIVVRVWNDRMVNLTVFDAQGMCQSRASVPLLQDDDLPPSAISSYAEWMPYQKGQAAMLDAVRAEHAAHETVEDVRHGIEGEQTRSELSGNSNPDHRLVPRAAPTQ